MGRPSKDGAPARAPNRRRLTELYLQRLKPPERACLVWDEIQRGLVLSLAPTGHRAFKVIYSFNGRPRWYHIGDARVIGLADARRLARGIMTQVADGKDPQAERKAQRSAGTFEELVDRYLAEYAQKKNKSWKQSRALVEKHLLPRWAKLKAADISKSDMKATMVRVVASRG